jgi:hypothetical protein
MVLGYFYQMKHKIIMYNELERWSREKAAIAYSQPLATTQASVQVDQRKAHETSFTVVKQLKVWSS